MSDSSVVRAAISHRVQFGNWFDDRRFEEMLALLEEHRHAFDDIVLHSQATHPVMNLETVAKRCEVMKKRVEVLKRRGFRVGVNILGTLGHNGEDIGHAPTGFVNITDINGRSEPGTFCPRHEDFREKIMRPTYEMFTKTGVDLVWIDDDLRAVGHGAVLRSCYCDRCVADLNRRYGTAYTRETLHLAVNTGSELERVEMRKKVMAFAGDTLVATLKFLADVVHAVDHGVEVGMMDAGMRPGDNVDLRKFADALSDHGEPVRWRPGGGEYSDSSLDAFIIGKGRLLGAEAAILPDEIVNIQSEIESFNYQRPAKSAHSTAMEACIYNASGMTGTAWNVMSPYDPTWVYRDLLAHISRVRPFMDMQVRSGGRVRPRGIWGGWTPDANAGTTFDGDWFTCLVPNDSLKNRMFTCGFPMAFRLEDADLTMLTGDTAWTLSDADLETILGRGLYCDAEALKILNRRGFGELTGFTPGEKIAVNAVEYLKPHPLNGDCAGYGRDARQYWAWENSEAACELLNADGRGETLAELRDYDGGMLCGCSLGLYENKLGGRVAVAGYNPRQSILYWHKIQSMKRLFCYLAHDKLSAVIPTYHRIALWARTPGADGKAAVNLVNATMDPAVGARLSLRGCGVHAELIGMYGDRCMLDGRIGDRGDAEFELPTLAPWNVYLLHEC